MPCALTSQQVKLLTVKTMRLLGARDLKRYRGWKGTAELIAKEFQKNKKTGEDNGTWHNGVIDETQARSAKAKAAEHDSQDVRARPMNDQRRRTPANPRTCARREQDFQTPIGS